MFCFWQTDLVRVQNSRPSRLILSQIAERKVTLGSRLRVASLLDSCVIDEFFSIQVFCYGKKWRYISLVLAILTKKIHTEKCQKKIQKKDYKIFKFLVFCYTFTTQCAFVLFLRQYSEFLMGGTKNRWNHIYWKTTRICVHQQSIIMFA